MLIPSIDLFDGKAVQWRKGKEPVLARDDVFELLGEFGLFGEVAVIDLNAATGRGNNRDLIFEMLRRGNRCRVGGGIRDLETARTFLKHGAEKIILGTAAREAFVRKLPREALVFAVDAEGDHLLTHGWREKGREKITDLIPELARNCSEFLYTQVEKEGMMSGIDRPRVEEVLSLSSIPVTVAGGITTLEEIRFLHRSGANAQIGMALYAGKITLPEAFSACVDFEKQPLVPTVVRDAENGEVLMLAYSNQASLAAAIAERRGVYFSRSRNEPWRKGETSGHRQRLVSVDVDCDGDTLLFEVVQEGNACHFPRRSCFARQTGRFRLSSLDRVLRQRQIEAPEGSYSATLFGDANLRAEKLREECGELIEAESFEHVRWEAADLLYFLLVEARAKGVSLADIESELRSRASGT